MRGFVAQTSINVVAGEYERGQCIVSDQHSDLTAAKKAVLPSVPWQRCQFHLMQNAMHYIPKLSMRKEAEEDLRAVYHRLFHRCCSHSNRTAFFRLGSAAIIICKVCDSPGLADTGGEP
jgi:transposase-like protein